MRRWSKWAQEILDNSSEMHNISTGKDFLFRTEYVKELDCTLVILTEKFTGKKWILSESLSEYYKSDRLGAMNNVYGLYLQNVGLLEYVKHPTMSFTSASRYVRTDISLVSLESFIDTVKLQNKS